MRQLILNYLHWLIAGLYSGLFFWHYVTGIILSSDPFPTFVGLCICSFPLGILGFAMPTFSSAVVWLGLNGSLNTFYLWKLVRRAAKHLCEDPVFVTLNRRESPPATKQN